MLSIYRMEQLYAKMISRYLILRWAVVTTIQYGRLLRILDKNTTLHFLFNVTFLQLYVPWYLVEGGVFQYIIEWRWLVSCEKCSIASSRKYIVVAKISSEEQWRNRCNSKRKELFWNSRCDEVKRIESINIQYARFAINGLCKRLEWVSKKKKREWAFFFTYYMQ